MSLVKLSNRLLLQIEIALDRECTCNRTLSSQEKRAYSIGLTGAEIDAARAQRSFDVQTAAAIDFACAVASCDQTRIFFASAKALAVGFEQDQLEQIAAFSIARSIPSMTD